MMVFRSSLYFLHCGECPVDGNILAFLRVFCMDKGLAVDCQIVPSILGVLCIVKSN